MVKVMDEQAATQPLSRRTPRWVLATLAAAAILLIAVAAIVVQRAWIAEQLVPVFLANLGFGTVTLTIDKLDFDGATATDLRIGDSQYVQKLTARYSLASLRRGFAPSVVVTGVTLRGKWAPAGLSFDGLPLSGGADTQQPAGLPIRSLRVGKFDLTIETPQGDVSVKGSANVETPDGDASDIDAKFEVNTDLANVVASVQGRLLATRFANGEAYGRAALVDGAAEEIRFKAQGMSGDIQFIALEKNVIDLDARLGVASLMLLGETLRDNKLTLGIRRDDNASSAFLVAANMANSNSEINATGTITLDDAGAANATISIAADIVRDLIQAELEGTAAINAAANGQVSGNVRVKDGRFTYQEQTLSGIRGNAGFSKEVGHAPKGNVAITIENVAGYSKPGQPASLAARLNDGQLEAQGNLVWQGGRLSLDAHAALGAPLTFEASGSIDGETSKTFLPDGYSFRGDTAFAFNGALLVPFETLPRLQEQPQLLLDQLKGKGYVESDIRSLTIPDLVDGGVLRGRVGIASNANGQQLATAGLTYSVDRISSSLLGSIPPALSKYLQGRLSGTLRPVSGDKATATLVRAPNGYEVTVSAATEVTHNRTKVSLEGSAEATLGDDGSLLSFAAPNAAGKVTNLMAADGGVSGDLAVTRLKMLGNQARGDFRFNGVFNGPEPGPLAPVSATAIASGTVRLNADDLTLHINPKSEIRVEPIEIPDRVKTTAPFIIATKEQIRAQMNVSEGLTSLKYDAQSALPQSRVSLKTNEGWVDAIASQAMLRVKGSGGTHSVRLTGGELHIPAQKLRAVGIDIDATFSNDIAANMTIATLHHEAAIPAVVPLQIAVSATKQNEQIEFKAQVADAPQRIVLNFAGQHDLSRDKGKATLNARKITFLPTVLQPAQLFPVLKGLTSEVDGDIDALANLNWAGGELNSSMEIFIDAKKVTTDEFTVENAVSVIKLDNLFPPTTPPKQEITIGALDIGIPLINGRAEFELNADGRILASLRELDFFGGRIETETFAIPPTFNDFSVPLLVTGAELEDLLELIQPKDITATGTLNGRIPIVIANGDIAVRNGILESADGGGSIRYRPEAEIRDSLAGANEGMSLLLKVVDDFKYDSARVTLNEDAFGDVAFRFQIKGRNPELYKGIPVHLNVAMDGPLRRLLSQSVKTFTLPEKILSQIQNFRDTP